MGAAGAEGSPGCEGRNHDRAEQRHAPLGQVSVECVDSYQPSFGSNAVWGHSDYIGVQQTTKFVLTLLKILAVNRG